MVRTPGFHPEDPGSIPHAGDFFLNFNSDTYFQSSAKSLSAAYYSFQHSVLVYVPIHIQALKVSEIIVFTFILRFFS